MKITIPTPCHEDWNQMSPGNNGRHCNSCMKTVIDFSKMPDEEVKYFLLNKKQEHVCGRFNSSQLQRIQIELPQNIFHMQMPWWKRFLVACLVVFSTTLFSCDIKQTDTQIVGAIKMPIKALANPADTIQAADTSTIFIQAVDTVYPKYIVGELAPMVDSVVIADPEITMGEPEIIQTDTIKPEPQIMGKMMYVPDSIRLAPIKEDSINCKKFQ